MQKKAPRVPDNIKLQQPANRTQVKTRSFSANFFKATFSSRIKAVPPALRSTLSVEETTKIGSAETKPVTRNRPRTVPPESPTKAKVKKAIDRLRPTVKRIDSADPERPLRSKPPTPDPGVPKPLKKNDLKTANVVLHIVKKAHAPAKPPAPKISESVLPPTLRPDIADKQLKLTKNFNNNDVWTNANDTRGARKRITSLPVVRGPSQGKQEATLKGAPSVSSLDSKHHKIAPSRDKTLKIFGSKEKLHKAHKKKDLGNNNAVLEDPELALEFEDGQVRRDFSSAEELGGSVDERGSQECVSLPVTLNADHMPGFQEVQLRPRVPSEASLASGAREIEALRRELEASAMERAQLQARVDELSEKVADAERLKTELERLKSVEAEREAALERLADENGALRARLRGVAHSPLSDSEKRQLLLAPAPRRMHSSAPASIALAHNGEGDSGEASTPEWDKHSSSSLSEVSVACLQDRILQMEEHHYSTSEELQATLAELADLQSQLADAHADNERLADEKQVLLESLCRQTEKLEDSRTKVDTLQELLLREGIEPESIVAGDADQQLFAVLKVSQEEKRHLLSKQEQLEAELNQTKTALEEKTKENETLAEKIRSLESSLERSDNERSQLQSEIESAKDVASARQHQITTLTNLLDAAKAKLEEREGGAGAEAEAAAAAARREAEAAAAVALALQERLAHAQRQLDRAHSDNRKMHDDAMVSRNNAKSTISELEFQIEQLRQEKSAMEGEMKTLQENVAELQAQVQVASEEKLNLMSRAGEALARASDFERQLQESKAKVEKLNRDRERDEADWNQFKSDLLMTVRVANDFKTEAQKELERLVSENKTARDRIRLLEDQIHSMKAIPPRTEETPPPPPLLTSASLQDIMATAASHRRTKGVSRQDSRLSVKSLIESIENAAKAAKQQSPSSTPTNEWPQVQTTVSVTTTTTNVKNGVSDPTPPTNGMAGSNFAAKPPASRAARASPVTAETTAASTNMPDEQRALATLQQKAIESFVRRNSYGDICERKDPLNALQVKNGGSKRNALLKWCQQKTSGYNNIDITNFSSSWNDGMALCALLHSYLGEGRIPYATLSPQDKRTNFSVAFAAAESVGIPTTLNIQDMIQQERPDWQQVMAYVTSIYKHFET